MHGEWPENQIDHINGVKIDNRICNLRLAMPHENQQNLAKPSRAGGTSSKYIGVTWCRRDKKWRAQITRPVLGVKNLGRFDTEEKAYEAYCAAKRKFHPFQPQPRTEEQ
jgi:hypothetical protein